MVLHSFVLAAMSLLAPNRDHTELASAIATVVETEAPLFRGDEDRSRTAAFMVAVAFREGSLRLDAVGDKGRALCTYQLWRAPREVLTDAHLCTSIAFARLRESMRACGPTNPLGIYAAGPKGCSSKTAERISADRLWLAKHLLATVTAGDAS